MQTPVDPRTNMLCMHGKCCVSHVAWPSSLPTLVFGFSLALTAGCRHHRSMHDTGGKAVQPATLDGRTAGLEQLTAGLYESMRFKPVGPVSIRQATQDFSLPPNTTSACPFGLQLKKGDSVIIYLEGVCQYWWLGVAGVMTCVLHIFPSRHVSTTTIPTPRTRMACVEAGKHFH